MPSISADASSASASTAAVSPAAFPSPADLDNLPAPLLIALLRSSYRRSQFDDVSQILAAREKSAAAADSRCADLERQLKDDKDRYAQLETKHGAVEESAENYKRVTELLHECQVILEAENAALRARVQQGQERIAQLQEQLQSTEISKFVELKVEVQDFNKCGKRRAEEEAQDWKRKYTDAQAQVLSLKVKAAAAENDKGINLSMGGTSRDGADICDGDKGEDDDDYEVKEEEQNGPESPDLMRLSSAGDVATSGEIFTPVQAPEDAARGEEEGGASAHPHCLIVISDSEEDHWTVGNGNSPYSISVCVGNVDATVGDGDKCGENSTPVSTQRTEGDPPIANRGEEDGDEDDTVPLAELKRKRMLDVASPEPNSPYETQSGTALELKRKRMSELARPEPNSPNKTQSELKRKRMSGLASPEPNSPNETESSIASVMNRKRMSDLIQRSSERNAPNQMQSSTTLEPKMKRMADVFLRTGEPNGPSKMHSCTASSAKFSTQQLEKRRKILTPMAIYGARRP